MAIRYNSDTLGARLRRTPETVQSTPQARGINPNVSFVKKQSFTPARKEPGKLPKWKKDLVESYKKLGIKPPAYTKKTRQQRENEVIQASLGTGTDNDPRGNVENTGPAFWEIYRKVSFAIITQEEEYEKPDGWPTSTFGNDLPDADDPWLEVERVHEIGYINAEREIKKEKFYVALAESNDEVTQHTLTVTPATPADPASPAANRIPLTLFNSAEAQSAIADANGEV